MGGVELGGITRFLPAFPNIVRIMLDFVPRLFYNVYK
jgi:hypothetical protein